MSTSTEYHVLVSMEEWIGNHEREITYWVWAHEEEYMPGGWNRPERPHVAEMAWGSQTDEHESALQPMAHDEYGLVFVTLDHPYWDFSPSSPLLWTLHEEPSDIEWEALVEACYSYPDATVTGVKLMKAVTTREQVR